MRCATVVLDEADWTTKRDLIRTLVRRIEVNDQHVRVVFRVDPGPTGHPDPTQISHLCPSRGLAIWWRRSWFSLKGTLGIRGQVRGRPATPARPAAPPAGSMQQRLGPSHGCDEGLPILAGCAPPERVSVPLGEHEAVRIGASR